MIRHLFLLMISLVGMLSAYADSVQTFTTSETTEFPKKDSPKTNKKSKKIVNELTSIHRVGVIPFSDLTQKNREQAEMLSEKLASQLVQTQMFEVKYPKEVIAAMLRLDIQEDTSSITPKQLAALGKELQVDALIVGDIKEVNLYEPVRISFALKMFITEESHFASTKEIWDLSSYGIPVDLVKTKDMERFSRVWRPQSVYDSSAAWLQSGIKKYAKEKNLSDHAFGWQYIIQSNERYLEYIAYDICESLKIAINPKYQKRNSVWSRLKTAIR